MFAFWLEDIYWLSDFSQARYDNLDENCSKLRKDNPNSPDYLDKTRTPNNIDHFCHS